jgi:hypothetical protein
MTISISFLMDVVCRCIRGATIKNLIDYTGKSKAYVQGALTAAISIGLIIETSAEQYVANKECATMLTNVPPENLKIEIFRSWLQRFEPFILFMRYVSSGDSTSIAAKKMCSFYILNRPVDSIEKLLVAWGKGTGILDNGGKSCICKFQTFGFANIDELRTNSERDIAIRVYLTESLTAEVYAWLEHDEIEELVSGLKKYLTDPRGAIECACRAFEDVLRRVACMHKLDVSKQNGISQVANYLYSRKDVGGNFQSSILAKQYHICQAIGDIRNMAGHSKEAKTMERWDVSILGASGLIQIVVTLIKSLYLYSIRSIYTF